MNDLTTWILSVGVPALLGAVGVYIKKRLGELDDARKEILELQTRLARLEERLLWVAKNRVKKDNNDDNV